jgi:UDP-N-acetylmuramate dehydrogenase
VRGELIENAPLAPLTWLRVGGPAEILFRPVDVSDLITFLIGTPEDIPVTVIGMGSNLLVRDGGVSGVVIRLGYGFMNIEAIDGQRIRAGTAALDAAVSRIAQQAGIAGIEFYRGIPGSIGGALRMNGGAYGRETKDILVEAVALDRNGVRHVLSNSAMHYTYRHCGADENLIFIEATYQGHADDKLKIMARMNDIMAKRETSQPIHTRTGGSIFKNPEGYKSWQLIDEAGGRGLMRGGAQISNLHCNFFVNTGNASAADLEDLGEDVRTRVKMQNGVILDWEIKRIGKRI